MRLQSDAFFRSCACNLKDTLKWLLFEGVRCINCDSLYPDMPRTQSMNKCTTGHDGVFTVLLKDVGAYVNDYSPTALRYNKTSETENLRALNFGVSKGQSFDRVLIFPNGPIRGFLATGDPSKLADKTRALLYVAITRARHSVAFVCDDHCCINGIRKKVSESAQ